MKVVKQIVVVVDGRIKVVGVGSGGGFTRR